MDPQDKMVLGQSEQVTFGQSEQGTFGQSEQVTLGKSLKSLQRPGLLILTHSAALETR